MSKEEFQFEMRYTGDKDQDVLTFALPGRRPAVFTRKPGEKHHTGFVTEQEGRVLIKRAPGLFEFIDQPGGGKCDCAALTKRVEALELAIGYKQEAKADKPKRDKVAAA